MVLCVTIPTITILQKMKQDNNKKRNCIFKSKPLIEHVIKFTYNKINLIPIEPTPLSLLD